LLFGGACTKCFTDDLADEAVIHVEDNGRGFETQTVSSQGNGLANMKRRLEQIGGRAELKSILGQGTTVSFHVPLTN
jgi:signal transduction histidine kinase